MVDDISADGQSARDWLLEQVVEEGPALIVAGRGRGPGEHPDPADDNDGGRDATALRRPLRDSDIQREKPHFLDDSPRRADAGEGAADVNAGAKRAAVWLGSGVAALAVLIVMACVIFGGGPDPVAPPQHRAPTAVVLAAPTTALLPAPQQNRAVPFTSRTDSCSSDGAPAGQLAARSPQALSDTASDSAWVCGRGPQESLLDGQVLHVQFSCDPSRPSSACSYMLASVAVTPGWVAKTPEGKEEWSQHRVVSRLQFNFFNGAQLVGDPFFVDTHDVHGPVPATLPAPALASRVDVIVLHTDRPPAAPLPTTTGPARPFDSTQAPAPGGLLDPAPGEPGAPPTADPATGGSDPVDATFAISQLQFFGHAPS